MKSTQGWSEDEAPNSKLQAPEKLQASSSKTTLRAQLPLRIGYWIFSGAWVWSLELLGETGCLLCPRRSVLTAVLKFRPMPKRARNAGLMSKRAGLRRRNFSTAVRTDL